MSDCLFCGIAARRIPARIVAEDERTVTFLDINPATRGHCLVIPRAHADDLLDISPEEAAACLRAAQRAARRALDVLGATGVNLMQSSRPAAWQTVFHYHVHVIPRYEGDPLVLPWTPAPADAAELDAVAAQLDDTPQMP